MKNKLKYFTLSVFISVLFLAGGCTDISDRNFSITETSADTSAKTGTSAQVTTRKIETEAVTTQNDGDTEYSTETYNTYVFSDADEKFIGQLVFTGDSICTGFSAYGILPKSQVIAQGSVAARNILDFKFKVDDNGGEYDVLTALVNAAPAHIVLTMGMNDLNISETDVFKTDYVKLISMIKTYCPRSEITVLSITPVRKDNDFTDNLTIDKYNEALKIMVEDLNDENVRYLDIGIELKNSEGELKSKYTSGDGLHLTKTAYYAILWQICKSFETE